MTPRDFCFWLQGYFELTGPAALEGMDEVRVDRLRAHVQLCLRCLPAGTRAPSVVNYLRRRIVDGSMTTLTAEECRTAAEWLNDEFEHVIDSTMKARDPAEQARLKDIHGQGERMC